MKFLYNKPALLYRGNLIVADLHIGIEREFFEKGIRIGRLSDDYEKELAGLVEETACRRLVLLGDVKHSIAGFSLDEQAEISHFLDGLSKRVELVIVKGNHDGWLQKSALNGNIRVYEPEGVRIGAVSLNHGHSWPSEEMMQADYLILAHNHPCIEFVDRLGYRSISRVWVIGRLDPARVKKKYEKFNKDMKVLVIPAFNELVGGLSFNRHKAKDLLGPLFRNEMFKLGDAEIYLLNGINLGKIKNLRY